jgi:transcriptional regulator with XRE-family HTH domain
LPRVGPRKRKGWRSDARSAPEVVAACTRLGKRIRELRDGLELSQEQLAEGARLASKHIQDIEYGRTNPTVATLVGIARALKVNIRDLFEDG